MATSPKRPRADDVDEKPAKRMLGMTLQVAKDAFDDLFCKRDKEALYQHVREKLGKPARTPSPLPEPELVRGRKGEYELACEAEECCGCGRMINPHYECGCGGYSCYGGCTVCRYDQNKTERERALCEEQSSDDEDEETEIQACLQAPCKCKL